MSNQTMVQRVLSIARGEIGVREGWDAKNGWNNRVKYTTWYAEHPNIKNPAFLTSAWCAIFVSWVAWKAGILGSVIPLHAWTPSGLSWFQKRGLVTKGSGARAGDVVYFYYASQGRVAHVGFVERVEGRYIYTIEGNTNTTGSRQGNGVYRLKRLINSNMYFCHPQYPAPLPTAPAITTTPKKTARFVSLSGLINAALTDPRKSDSSTTNWGAVYPVEQALIAEGLLDARWLDGHYGTLTKAAYTVWQKKLGYSGKDADGIPGAASLKKLGDKHGFTVTK